MPNNSFDRPTRQIASHQSWAVLFASCVVGGQPLNSSVTTLEKAASHMTDEGASAGFFTSEHA